ncbi:phage major capsid protein [Caballeronia sp. LZ065]|uniref:phage major capsid protein n=1 Tax=Caballeronia sp. LZ065 TaxID=3038571 RepID=UPI002863E78C|nr:phage major capsid protein [Caballeronia sp. LZ065]MDR5778772.1 phage major capsid protein [Caballeronia sp. LZ065]
MNADELRTGLERISTQVLEQGQKAHTRIDELQAQVDAVEKKYGPGATRTAANTAARVSQIAGSLKDSTQLQAFKSGEAKEARVVINSYGTKATVVSDGATPSITPFAQTVAGITAPLFETPTLESLLPHAQMGTGKIEWTREAAGADWTGAVQAEQGDAKKQAAVTFENLSANASTIAVYIKASEQALDDSSGLAAYIEQRLSDGIAVGTEAQILNGTGTNGQMSGILLTGNHVALNTTGLAAGATGLDRLRRARTQVRNAFGRANAVLLNPNDAEDLDLIKDSEGRYILGGPSSGAPAALWGMQPVETTAIEEGDFVALDTQRSATIYDRQELVLTIGRDGDDLTKNLITIRAEVRKTLAVNRPALIVVGSFASA